MRKLASIQRIVGVDNHPNADRLDIAQVLGWKVVAGRGEFAVGDFAVYFEIDSVLPVREHFEFLRKGCYVKRDWLEPLNGTGDGMRLKTIRLRNQLSQGLLMPLSKLGLTEADQIEGLDLTERLGLVKWDPPVPAQLEGIARCAFPDWGCKTDQERVQNLYGDIAPLLVDHSWVVEEKLDGSSMSVGIKDGDVHVCSRNFSLVLEDPENSLIAVATQTGVMTALKELHASTGRNLMISGELCGPAIQGNAYKLPTVTWYVFDIFDVDTQEYLRPAARNECLEALSSMGFKSTTVPELETFQGVISLDELLTKAEGKSVVGIAPEREGLVFKSTQLNRSFKVISNRFLEKEA
jgi:RNA ligase (TIGR02306 family)